MKVRGNGRPAPPAESLPSAPIQSTQEPSNVSTASTFERAPQTARPTPVAPKSTSEKPALNAVTVRKSVPDPSPMGMARQIALAVGLEGGFLGRIPIHHLRSLSEIRDLRPKLIGESSEQLRARLVGIRERLESGTSRREVVPETFAVVREMSRRTLGKEHYEVQLLAGMAIAERNVAQLRTGEGKTLSASLASVLLGLEGKGCHVATTSTYLAKRDAEELRPLYEALGLTVGAIDNRMTYDEKRAEYRKDITYGHADAFAFDWLEDQTWWREDWKVQRGLHAVIVDEADDVLLDSAHQPLVLCGAPEGKAEFEARKGLLRTADELAQRLDLGTHVEIDVEQEKRRPYLTDEGVVALESAMKNHLGLSSAEEVWRPENLPLFDSVLKSLEARVSIERGKDYVDLENQVTLVSPGTGHPNPGARLRHGLSSSLLVKEGRDPEPELTTIGVTSYQGFFNSYRNLSGMTGTARGGRDELRDLYGLGVIEVPTNKPVQRTDEPDRLFPHRAPRLLAAIADIADTHQRGQPVLVSTVSVSASREVSARLANPLLALVDVAVSSDGLCQAALKSLGDGRTLGKLTDERRTLVHAELVEKFGSNPGAALKFAEFLESKGLPAKKMLNGPIAHRVLNAETHAAEAEILSNAGKIGAVTVATQMAGRGVDIPIDDASEKVGGLRVVGVERKSNGRKDDQVRGRAGRKGQPGSSVFYVAPSDDVLTYLPASELRSLASRLATNRIGDLPSSVRRAFEGAVTRAQARCEGMAESRRRQGTKLDGVVQAQRRAMLAFRNEILSTNDLSRTMTDWLHLHLEHKLRDSMNASAQVSGEQVAKTLDSLGITDAPGPMSLDALQTRVESAVQRRSEIVRETRKEDPAAFNQYLRDMLLFELDQAWIGHLEHQEHRKGTAHLLSHGPGDLFTEHALQSSRDFEEVIDAAKRQIGARFAHHLRTGAVPPKEVS